MVPEGHKPCPSVSFPRTIWGNTAPYWPDFEKSTPAEDRVRFGGRNASQLVSRAADPDDQEVSLGDITDQVLMVAIFDKVIELNDAQRQRAHEGGRAVRLSFDGWKKWLVTATKFVLQWAARDVPALKDRIQLLEQKPDDLHKLILGAMDQGWRHGIDSFYYRTSPCEPTAEVISMFGPQVFISNEEDKARVWPRVSYRLNPLNDDAHDWFGPLIGVTWVNGEGKDVPMPDEQWAKNYAASFPSPTDTPTAVEHEMDQQSTPMGRTVTNDSVPALSHSDKDRDSDSSGSPKSPKVASRAGLEDLEPLSTSLPTDAKSPIDATQVPLGSASPPL